MVITLPFTTLRTFRAQPSIRPSPCRGIAETQPLVSLPTVQGRNPSHQTVSLQYRGGNAAISLHTAQGRNPSHQTVSLQYRGGNQAIRQSPYSTGAEPQPSDSLATVQGRKPNHQSPYSTGAETQPSVSLQYRGGNPATKPSLVVLRQEPSHLDRNPANETITCSAVVPRQNPSH